MKKKLIVLVLIVLLLGYIGIGLHNELTVTTYEYTNAKLPSAFDGYKILQISDLHCKRFGSLQTDLIDKIKDCNPDIILLTGDIIDRNTTDITPLIELLMGLDNAYPLYYVTGNHELEPRAAAAYKKMLDLFASYHVTLLDDTYCEITKEETSIRLYGQKFRSRYVTDFIDTDIDTNYVNILLYHASDYFDLLARYNYDLVFSGHLHGGVIRLPFIGGLLSADGSLFPRYDKGVYVENNTTLIASSGLGDARIPRFYNEPELVLVTLKSGN